MKGMILLERDLLVYGYPSDVAIGSRAFLMAKDSQITLWWTLGHQADVHLQYAPNHFILYPAFALYCKTSQGINSFLWPQTNRQQISNEEKLHLLLHYKISHVPKLLAAIPTVLMAALLCQPCVLVGMPSWLQMWLHARCWQFLFGLPVAT